MNSVFFSLSRRIVREKCQDSEAGRTAKKQKSAPFEPMHVTFLGSADQILGGFFLALLTLAKKEAE